MGMRYAPLESCLRVTRGSPKILRGADGILREIGVDVPGHDHDALGRAKGLLIEAAASNLLRYSTAFSNPLWEKEAGVSVSTSGVAAPDGSMTATRLDLPGGAGGFFQRVDDLIAGEVYSFGVWARAVSGTAEITLGGVNGASNHAVSLDESWQRVGFAEVASGTSRCPKISTAISGNPASILIWNAQLEAGPVLTSDMISKGIPAARAMDDVMLEPGDWFRGATGRGTFVFDLELPAAWAGIWRIVQMHSGNLNDDHLDLGYDSAADQLRISLRKAGVPIISQSLYGGLVPGARTRIVLAWADDGVAVAKDGAVLKSPGGFAMPRNFNVIRLGSYTGQSGALNGHLRGVSYWPERLGDDRLIAISVNSGN
ncbi:phage head spike fiber domain-containing protein [Thalassospira xiamenensis]|uniref:phage head spike fiber domain-containing protein n=1 Tax=Thalassospira xiamenensis TaxID=220697 RepID=UPI003AA8FB30